MLSMRASRLLSGGVLRDELESPTSERFPVTRDATFPNSHRVLKAVTSRCAHFSPKTTYSHHKGACMSTLTMRVARCARVTSRSRLAQTRKTFSTSATRNAQPEDPTMYCRQLVLKQDYDSYLSSYFYPRHLQDAYFALRAFNVGVFLRIPLKRRDRRR